MGGTDGFAGAIVTVLQVRHRQRNVPTQFNSTSNSVVIPLNDKNQVQRGLSVFVFILYTVCWLL